MDKSSPILDNLNSIFCLLIVAALLRVGLWLWRDGTRVALRALHFWAESNHVQLIDIRPRWRPSALMNPWTQRLFDIDVVDTTGRKRRGQAVCGPQFWWQSSKTVYVDWAPDRGFD